MPYATAEKRRIGRRQSYLKRKDTILAQERRYRVINPHSKRQIQYKRRYGITLEQFNEMVAAQGGRCAVCREEFKPAKKKLAIHVDHCHDTLKVRGILCSRCNVGIGLLGDNVAGLQRAIDYLQKE